MTTSARTDWEARIADRSDRSSSAPVPSLAAPTGLRARSGVGHVTLDWDPVPDAVGYLVHRAADGEDFAVVDHHGMDVLAVPHPPYTDTTGIVCTPYRYAVSAIAEVTDTGTRGPSVTAAALPPAPTRPAVRIEVDASDPGRPLPRPWEPMIGSERLSQLRSTDESGGRPIGQELRAALGRMHDEIGVRTVRAHAIFSEDTRVYREIDGEAVHDFRIPDEIYDAVLDIGLAPVVELGFMPRDLAADPGATVFDYRAIVSPPRDWDRWHDLVADFVAHLLDRYGDRVLQWDFEVWNEANLDVFWSSDEATWLRFYDTTADAVKSVDPRIAVGGPSSAAAGWVDDLLDSARRHRSPVDFVSTHTYGSPPLDVRPVLERYGFGAARILWTEWGVTPTHFNPVNDTVFAATFLLTGMRSAAGRVDALSYWVASDHFEELGRPPRLLHGGFGLMSVGGLPKPRFHAMTMLSKLGAVELPTLAEGDGADGLVQVWASRDPGRIAVLIWDATLNQDMQDSAGSRPDAARLLDRRVTLTVPGLPDGAADVTVTRLRPGHGDLGAAAARQGIGDWPDDDDAWAALGEGAALPAATEPAQVLDGRLTVVLDLVMPEAVLVEIRPGASR